jgi:hypothetical protein
MSAALTDERVVELALLALGGPSDETRALAATILVVELLKARHPGDPETVKAVLRRCVPAHRPPPALRLVTTDEAQETT